MNALSLALLDRIEQQEANLLSWGFVGGSFTWDEMLAAAEAVLAEAPEPDGLTADDLCNELHGGDLVLELPFEPGNYRSRFAEAVRLLFHLRQLTPAKPWDAASRLVADYRLVVRHRRFPRFEIEPDDAVDRAADSTWDPVERRALAALVGGTHPRRLANFQLDALRTVRGHLRRSAPHGTIVTAGTGSGKTLAAYLPALVEVSRLVQPNEFWTKMLCLYPRNELLRDQLLKVLQETERLAGAGLPRAVRVGAFFYATPENPNSIYDNQGWEPRAGGLVCPFLRCPSPGCGGELLWPDAARLNDQERLKCLRCRRTLDEDRIALTRRGMEQRPPDLLFTSTESLNRQLGSARFRGLFGVGRPVAMSPRLVLLDEVHTYDDITGAQTALLLRRWRHAVGDRPVRWVGLSATLRNPVSFFAQLTGLPEDRIVPIDPRAEEVEGGLEYLIAARGDPASRRSLLSTTIQSAMLLGRTLDPLPPNPGAVFNPRSGGVVGQKAFVFSDDMDVINRLYHDLRDAESNPPRFSWKDPLANLRDPNRPDAYTRDQDGQNWWMPERLGHRLDIRSGLAVARTTSADRGVDDGANLVVCSASLEVGFDDDRVGAVIQHKAPHSLASFLQRKGRAGRRREARPWTLLVLSDYGRDRIAYQAPEHLFDPTLPPRHLPVRNRYVLRIQAVFAFLDWAASRAERAGRRMSAWTALTGPVTNTTARRDQMWLADLIADVLDQPGLADELARHVGDALGIDTEEVRRVMWESPRPLLTGVLPTALRRLLTNWEAYRPDGTPGEDIVEHLHPLPEFMPANLFSDLQLPELGLTLPMRGRTDRKRMPLVQGMSTFAPGRVSRRFANDRDADVSHWVSIEGLAEEDVTLDRFCVALPLGNFEFIDDHGAVSQVPTFRPLEYTLELCPEKEVAISSNSFLRWHTQLFARSEGVPLPLPAPRPFDALELGLVLFTHAQSCPAAARRFATGADADFRRVGAESTHCSVRFVAGGEPAAVGFEIPVDGLRVRFRPPLADPHTWFTPELLRAYRPQFFRHRVCSDPHLTAVANHFLLGWMAEIHLAALTAAACEPGADGGLVAASARLDDNYPDRTAAVMDNMIQFLAVEGEELDETSLRAQLAARFNLPQVRQRLGELAQALWEEPSREMEYWLRARFKSTLGAAFLQACHQTANQVESGDLCLDLDPGTPPDDTPPSDGTAEFWVTEVSPGGCGIVEAVGRAVRDRPDRFFDELRDALGASDFEQIDLQLTRLVGEAQVPGRLAEALAGVRNAANRAELTDARDGLIRTLSAAGYIPSRPLLVAINARVLTPNSTPAHDALLSQLLALRDQIETRLGIEVGYREFAFLAGRDEAIQQAVEAAIGPPVDGNHLYRMLLGLLWPRQSVIRAAAESGYNPFATAAPPDRLLVRSALAIDAPTIDAVEPDWRERVSAELGTVGRAVVRFHGRDRAFVRAMCLELVARPAEVGYLQVYPAVAGLTIEGDVIDADLRVRGVGS
jgi:hypothetical protein